MKFEELLNLANESYPDGYLTQVWDEVSQRPYANGDTLALAIVNELWAAFRKEQDMEKNVTDSLDMLDAMRNDLEHVILRLVHYIEDGK